MRPSSNPPAALLSLLVALAASPVTAQPERLSETGLYATIAMQRIADGVVSFTPQYPLWSDGAVKRRWMSLPPGAFIDASDPDAWEFPVGTKFWKEFSFGRKVETRTIERTEDGWRFASYRWLPDESDAVLVSEYGERGVLEIAPGVKYDLPSRYDCRACHDGNVSRVLGFSALQLSGDRDPNAVHAESPGAADVDLDTLVERGLVRGLPETLVTTPPRIAAASATERAALGYLHGNCASCHNDRGALADLGLSLEVRMGGPGAGAPPPLGQVAQFQPAGEPASLRLAAGHPEGSAVVRRMARRDPINQMPPLGTKVVDREAIALLERWIRTELAPSGESLASIKEGR
jgi:mono/diheme cytochrome c family protein